MYDSQAFDFIKTLNPSQRGELEITDLNNFYINQGTMTWSLIYGWWTDAGTLDSLLKAFKSPLIRPAILCHAL